MLKILNFRQEKLKPEAILIVNNVRKVLVRLTRKSPRIPIELHLTSLISINPQKTPSPIFCRKC